LLLTEIDQTKVTQKVSIEPLCNFTHAVKKLVHMIRSPSYIREAIGLVDTEY
jgi:hypothetical protein